MGEHIDSDVLIREMQKEAASEKKASSREIASLKKMVETLERRKQAAEDKWLDGDINKEQ